MVVRFRANCVSLFARLDFCSFITGNVLNFSWDALLSLFLILSASVV